MAKITIKCSKEDRDKLIEIIKNSDYCPFMKCTIDSIIKKDEDCLLGKVPCYICILGNMGIEILES